MSRTESVCAKCQSPISAAQVSGAWVDRRGVATCPRGGWHEPGGSQLLGQLQADVFGPHSLIIAGRSFGKQAAVRAAGYPQVPRGAITYDRNCKFCHRAIGWDPHLGAWVDRRGSNACSPGRIHVPPSGH